MVRRRISTAEAAAAMGVSRQRVAQLAAQGRIKGAERLGNGQWAIPVKIRIRPVRQGRPPKPKQ